MNIRETVKNVMSVVFEMPIDQIKDDSSPDNIGTWDSLKHINLALALEEEFDIEFTDEEIIELVNMKLILIVIEERLKDGSD